MNRLVCLAGLLAGAGCGLIDSSVADVNFSLPERMVTVDTADWELAGEGEVPAVECTGMEEICADAMAAVCGNEDVCSGACGGANCEINVAVSLWQKYDLAAESQGLEAAEGQPLVSVTIDRIRYTIVDNTFNTDTPPMTVYIAPEGVMSPDDPQAQAVGDIPPVTAMTKPEGDLELTSDGQDVLAEHFKDYQTPFNLIVGSDILVQAGDPMPMGRLVAVVQVEAHAGL